MPDDGVVCPVTVIHIFAPIFGCVSGKVVPETLSLRFVWSLYVGIVGKHGCKVCVQNNILVACAGRYLFGIADDKRHAEWFLIHHSFIKESMFSQEVSLV